MRRSMEDSTTTIKTNTSLTSQGEEMAVVDLDQKINLPTLEQSVWLGFFLKKISCKNYHG